MGFEANPIADCGSETIFPTVDDLISHLRTSFFSLEFQYVAKTLMDREQHIVEKHLKLKTKVEEEKSLLFSENLKLKEELKKKQDEIEATRKLNAELERKIRVSTKRSLDFGDNVPSLEINLEDKQQKDPPAESNRPPLFSEKEDSKKKTEPKLPGIIHIDDDDDDGHTCISTLKGKRVSNQIKRECMDDDDDIEFISMSKRTGVINEVKKEYNTNDDDVEFISTPKRRRVSMELDSSASDSDSDTEIKKLYMSSISKMKKQKERWESESDMVKELESNDELCLNGICALDRQRIIVHGTDILRMANLASKLSDGDSQRQLKKKASELNRIDLDHCRMFAKKYSLQLLNIYQKKSDPFFPTSACQEKKVR